MTKTVEIEKEYQCDAKKAIHYFFKKYPELDYWKEQFEWMAKNNVDFFADTKMADGTKNHDWCYALHLDQFEGDHTYICIIERA